MDVDLDLESFRIVAAVAQHGSITAAARTLGWSQPTVSKHIRKLESQLGLPVMQRSGRAVRLTEAGEALARHAGAVMSTVDAAKHDLAALRGLSSGTVRIVAFPTASSTLVPVILKRLRTQHPGIIASYQEAEPPEARALLRAGLADLALAFRYPADHAAPDPGATMRAFALYTEEMLAVLPADHPLARRNVVNLADLSRDRWIAGCPVCRRHLLTVCQGVGFSPDVALTTDNAHAALRLVSLGLGVALLPKTALAASAAPEDVVVRSIFPSDPRLVEMVVSPGSERIPSIAAALRITLASVTHRGGPAEAGPSPVRR